MKNNQKNAKKKTTNSTSRIIKIGPPRATKKFIHEIIKNFLGDVITEDGISPTLHTPLRWGTKHIDHLCVSAIEHMKLEEKIKFLIERGAFGTWNVL